MKDPQNEDEPIEVAELVEAALSPGPGSLASPEGPSHQVSNTALGRGEIVASIAADSPLAFTPPPPIPEDMDNVAAVGGAVGAFVLGIWSIVGSFITPWSVINSGLGALLGLWGLTSRRRRLATIGIILCGVGFVLASIQISTLIQMLFRETDTEGY